MPEENTQNPINPEEESPKDKTNEIIIPTADWHTAIADAINGSTEPTVLVVDTDAKKELALIAADRLGKRDNITVRVAIPETEGQ